jgi:lipoprotein-releasing system ATP-binding protein
MSLPVVSASQVTRQLPGPVPVTLVEDIDFAAESGELVAITGASGSGKSSLLYLLGLLDRPTGGEIRIAGEETKNRSGDELAAIRLEKLGFVFQFHFLLPEFSAIENVMIPMRKLGKLSLSAMRERAASLLAELDLAFHADKRPDQLSGGERQRVAIARALANQPPILLADEPTGNLDSRNAQNVFNIFQKLARESGKTVIVVTHDRDLAMLCDRRILLVDGKRG